MNKMFRYIEEKSPEYIDFLAKICSYETPSGDKEALDAMVGYIEGFAAEAGFCVERKPMKECGDFLTIDINPGAEKGSVFLAHMDTVHQKGIFGYPCVTVENGCMRAPGVIDCKGGIAIALLAMDAMAKNNCTTHNRLILTSDEEISNILGGQDEQEFIRSSVTGFKSALNCETTVKNEVVIARKGILRKEITIKGIGGHSGMAYFDSASAIREAAYKIIELEKNSRRGEITYNCSVIKGGNIPNCIPDNCSFTVDIRMVSYKDVEKAERLVDEVAAASFVEGTESTVRNVSSRPPMEKNKNTNDLFDRLNRVSIKYNLGQLIPTESGGGSDSAYTHLAGVPSICGMGGEGGFCHTNKEYIELDSVANRAKLLAAFCTEE